MTRWLFVLAGATIVAGCASAVEPPREESVARVSDPWAGGSSTSGKHGAREPSHTPPTPGHGSGEPYHADGSHGSGEPYHTDGNHGSGEPYHFREPPKLARNLTMKTLGGRQFWGDVQFFHGWRIQQNVFTRHYRLLDEQDYRHASGTLAECQARLDEIRQQLHLPPMSGKAVVLVHGIIRSSKSFHKLRGRLEREGYCVFGFDYPSTRIAIPEAAERLHQCLCSLEGIEEIHLVVHSMGGLVVRTYLVNHQDPRLRRMVMIGVPNRGAEMADCLRGSLVYKAVLGPAGQQLVTGDGGYIASLPTPAFEFGILSGARGTIHGCNPLVPGDDDGTVSVASTRLPGAADFVTVRGLHSFLMNHDDAIEHTVRFLATGRFRATGDPHRIPAADAEQSLDCDGRGATGGSSARAAGGRASIASSHDFPVVQLRE